jgi:hypothetical protein
MIRDLRCAQNDTKQITSTGTLNQTALMPFEILNRAFVFLRRCLALERAEIFSFARSRIFLAGIQPILAGFQFPDHVDLSVARCTPTLTLPSPLYPERFQIYFGWYAPGNRGLRNAITLHDVG